MPSRCWHREGTREVFVNKHPPTAQILAVFMVKTLPTNKARFQEPAAGLKQPGRRRITWTCAGSPRSSRAQATLNIQKDIHLISRVQPEMPPAAVTSWKDTGTSPHLFQVWVSPWKDSETSEHFKHRLLILQLNGLFPFGATGGGSHHRSVCPQEQ